MVQQQTSTDESNRSQDHAQSYFSRLFSPENLPNIGLLIAAIAAFCVAIRTLNHMRDSSERQLRAYVFPETADILEGTMLNPPLIAKANIPWVHMSIKNSGQTPAYNVISLLQIAVTMASNESTLSTPLPMQRASMQFSANNLGPGSTFTKGSWFDRPLTAPEIADVATGARSIFLYGRIEYTDAFEVRRFTNFKLRYNGPFPPIPNSIFNFCEGGNDAN